MKFHENIILSLVGHKTFQSLKILNFADFPYIAFHILEPVRFERFTYDKKKTNLHLLWIKIFSHIILVYYIN